MVRGTISSGASPLRSDRASFSRLSPFAKKS
jgi:hypothetical protein